jgi:predicted MPP superfamily phosphohydrolase
LRQIGPGACAHYQLDPPMLSRRSLLCLLGAGILGSTGLSSYAFAIEPRFRLVVTRYRFQPPRWPRLDRPLRVAAIADIHACRPWMPASRIAEIVDITNAVEPDLIVLLGDYVAGLARFRTGIVRMRDWGRVLGRLSAPLGIYAVLGNHDWWTDANAVRSTLVDNGIGVLENQAQLIRSKNGFAFWLAGLGDQLAIPKGRGRFEGVHDLPGTIAQIGSPDPAILLAHEPDIFPQVPARVSLTLCGHTHGGQINLPLLGRLIVPSRFGQRYAYGHVVEADRHLVVSAGLGCSILPARFGVPPEIVVLELG